MAFRSLLLLKMMTGETKLVCSPLLTYEYENLLQIIYIYIWAITNDRDFLCEKVREYCFVHYMVNPITREYNLFMQIKILKYHDNPTCVDTSCLKLKICLKRSNELSTYCMHILSNVNDMFTNTE